MIALFIHWIASCLLVPFRLFHRPRTRFYWAAWMTFQLQAVAAFFAAALSL